VPPSHPPTTVDAADAVARWQRLDPDAADRHRELTARLEAGLRFEAADGFELTDVVRATVAARAALLTLELADDCLDLMGPVIVHAGAIEVAGPHAVGDGLMSDDPVALAGEAHHRGPVLLAWDEVTLDVARPERGRDVVLHELAHQLDMVDGWVDGTPPVWGDERAAWIEVCTAALDRLRAGDSPLDPYGASDPGEFFAVAVEAFFTRPAVVRHHEPDLYAVLSRHLDQDPAARGVGAPYAAPP